MGNVGNNYRNEHRTCLVRMVSVPSELTWTANIAVKINFKIHIFNKLRTHSHFFPVMMLSTRLEMTPSPNKMSFSLLIKYDNFTNDISELNSARTPLNNILISSFTAVTSRKLTFN